MGTTDLASFRSITVPAEHGGWSLTLEPAILGLIVAPSAAGFAIAAAGLVAFIARTPLRVVLVDRYRERHLDRTSLARRAVAVEALVLVALVTVAAVTAEGTWWPPLAPAAGLIAVELWYDVRSRSRRLVPEVAGTVGVSALAASIALAGGSSATVAYGLWLAMAARAVAAVFFVRLQLRRAKGQPHRLAASDLAQVITTGAVILAVGAGALPLAAAFTIAALGGAHIVLARRRPPPAVVVGAQQVVFGLTVVLVIGLASVAP